MDQRITGIRGGQRRRNRDRSVTREGWAPSNLEPIVARWTCQQASRFAFATAVLRPHALRWLPANHEFLTPDRVTGGGTASTVPSPSASEGVTRGTRTACAAVA